MISDIPLPFPVGAVRIGKIDGNFVVNPNEEDLLENTDLDLIVSGSEEAILMVEAGANEVPEAEILDALDIAHSAIKKLCAAQRELAEKAGKPKREFAAPAIDEGLLEAIKAATTAPWTRPRRSRTSSTARTPPTPSRPRSSRRTPAIRPGRATPSSALASSPPSPSSRSRSCASASPCTRSARRPRRAGDPSDHRRSGVLPRTHARASSPVARRRSSRWPPWAR